MDSSILLKKNSTFYIIQGNRALVQALYSTPLYKGTAWTIEPFHESHSCVNSSGAGLLCFEPGIQPLFYFLYMVVTWKRSHRRRHTLAVSQSSVQHHDLQGVWGTTRGLQIRWLRNIIILKHTKHYY